jgi:hypothetical protein
MDGHPYGVEMLCHDPTRFRSLLGGTDSEDGHKLREAHGPPLMTILLTPPRG